MRFVFLLACLLAGYHQAVTKSFPSRTIQATVISDNITERYELFEESVRRNEASSRCEGRNRQLATFKSQEDLDDIKAILKREFYDKIWIGGVFYDTDDCRREPLGDECWFWDEDVDEPPFFDSTLLEFRAEAHNHLPSVSSGMVLLKDQGKRVELDHDYGSAIHTYICENPKPPCNCKPPPKSSKLPNCKC